MSKVAEQFYLRKKCYYTESQRSPQGISHVTCSDGNRPLSSPQKTGNWCACHKHQHLHFENGSSENLVATGKHQGTFLFRIYTSSSSISSSNASFSEVP